MENTPCTYFSQNEILKFYDCDYLGRMKLSAILKWSSEIAGRDYTLKGFSHERLWKDEMVFLLSRVSVGIKRYPTQQEELKITTWESGTRGAMFMRKTEIEDATGEAIISLESGWILANPLTRHIYKPSHFQHEMPQDTEREIFAEKIGKIKYNELENISTYDIEICSIDANGHLYNSNYADIASNIIGKNNFERVIKNFRINYICEAVLGEKIELYKSENDNEIIVIGKVQDKTCFECIYTY